MEFIVVALPLWMIFMYLALTMELPLGNLTNGLNAMGISDIPIDQNIKVSHVFIQKGNDLTFELSEGKETLDGFLSKKLSKQVFIEKDEILVSIFKALENWLKKKEYPVSTFTTYVRLYDPNLEPQYKGSNIDEFRNQCLKNLGINV